MTPPRPRLLLSALVLAALSLRSPAAGAAAGFGGGGGAGAGGGKSNAGKGAAKKFFPSKSTSATATATAAKSSAVAIPLARSRGGGGGAAASDDESLPAKRPLTPADLAIAGGLATMVGDAMLHPIDCIKTLQQSGSGASLGFAGAARTIWEGQGIGGFYSGLGTYIAADGGAGAVKFATYEAIKKYVSDRLPDEKYVGPALFGCAALAYMASSVVLIPGELIKQRMQMGQASSFTAAVGSIWKNDGISGFFAGYQGVWLRDIPYTALELGIYDNVKSAMLKYQNRPKDASVSQTEEIIAGGISGGITGYLTNPLDLIKTKLMVDGDLYSGFLDAARQTYDSGGLGALFHGAGARVGYILPFCALYLPVYEVIKRRMERVGTTAGTNDPPAAAFVPAPKINKTPVVAAKVGRGGEQSRSLWGGPMRRSEGRCYRLDRDDNFVSF